MATTKTRMAWPDIAKGISILGVVTLHVGLAVPEGMDTTLAKVNALLDPLRMPLFFLVSGFFATKIFNFTFSQLFARRLWFFLVPYLVWVPVELWLKYREYAMVFGTDPLPWSGYAGHVLQGNNMAWFLYALVLFNVILWLTRKMPRWGVVLVALSPLLLLPVHYDWHMAGKAVLYLPVFLAGAYLRPTITRFAATALTPWRLVFAAGTYAAGLGLMIAWNRFAAESRHSFELPWPLAFADTIGTPEVRLPVMSVVQLLMLPTAIALTVIIAKIPYLAQGLQKFGRNTLIIYLSHPIAFTIGYHYLQAQLDIVISRDADVWWHTTHFWMIYLFVLTVIGSLIFQAISRTPVLKWTLTPPKLPEPGRRAPKTVASAAPRRSTDAPVDSPRRN